MAIHPTAVIDPTAIVSDDVEIGPNVVVGPGAEIGPGCELMAGAIIGPYTILGKNNRVHYHALIGGDPQYIGFDRKVKSRVRVGDGNEFREYCSVHRPIKEGAETVLGNSNYLMGTTHVAHDCILGNNITMVNFSALAGHCEVADRAFISGLVGVHQFCRIGRLAMVGGHSGVTKDVPPFLTVKGGIGFLSGVNTVGMRRAGVASPARLAVKSAFREIFRSRRSVPSAVAAVRAEWNGKEIPAELLELLTFCETKCKRGIMAGRSLEFSSSVGEEEDE